jgi:hypothetical protein
MRSPTSATAGAAAAAAVALTLAGVVAWPSLANADQRSYKGLVAQPILRFNTALPSNVAHTFATADLRSTNGFLPDTIMIVKRGSQSWSNDDCTAQTRASCLTVPAVAGGGTQTYTITVFTPWFFGYGTTDLFRDSIKVIEDGAFGGLIIRPQVAADGKPYTFSTVHIPGGVSDSKMLLLGADFKEKAYSDDTGPGFAAQISATIAVDDMILIGAYSAGTLGDSKLNLVINECPGENLACHSLAGGDPDRYDSDGDWLSNPLEVELGTNPNKKDSDDDGLIDYVEVIGHRSRVPWSTRSSWFAWAQTHAAPICSSSSIATWASACPTRR